MQSQEPPEPDDGPPAGARHRRADPPPRREPPRTVGEYAARRDPGGSVTAPPHTPPPGTGAVPPESDRAGRPVPRPRPRPRPEDGRDGHLTAEPGPYAGAPGGPPRSRHHPGHDEPDHDPAAHVAPHHEDRAQHTPGPGDGPRGPAPRRYPVEDTGPRTSPGGRPRTVSDAARERGLPVVDPPAAPATGHGHGHGHGPATPAGRRVRILLAALLGPCALAALIGIVVLWPGTSPVPTLPPQQQVHGDVQSVQAADCTPGTGSGGCTGVTLRMTNGPRAGRDLVQLVPTEPSTPRFAPGDRIVLAYSGGNPDEAGSYQITDFQRGGALAWLAGAFALAVLLLGRWRGLAALAALVLTFVALVLFVLPSILSGHNPLAVAVTGAGVIMFVVLYLSHGLSARTSCAVLGTLVSLALIGVLGALFSATTQLTGLDDTTANLIGTLGNAPIDARGLVLAGLVIGALGVLDDVTVTQASAVWEVRDANPSLGARALFAAGMRIGRDHVSSAVNTLVLAYAGASLPLLLLFTVSSAGFGQVVTSQDVATEIVRTLVGSIGLVASVPVTTGLAALVAARDRGPA